MTKTCGPPRWLGTKEDDSRRTYHIRDWAGKQAAPRVGAGEGQAGARRGPGEGQARGYSSNVRNHQIFSLMAAKRLGEISRWFPSSIVLWCHIRNLCRMGGDCGVGGRNFGSSSPCWRSPCSAARRQRGDRAVDGRAWRRVDCRTAIAAKASVESLDFLLDFCCLTLTGKSRSWRRWLQP